MPEKLLINKIWLNSGCGDSGIYREWENRRRIVKNIREIFQKLKNIHWAYAILIIILYLDNRLVNVIIRGRLSLVVRTLFGSLQIASSDRTVVDKLALFGGV